MTKSEMIYKSLILLFWIFLAYAIVLNYDPMRVTHQSFKFNKSFHFFPQGWGFFTKSPQEDLFSFYEINQNEVEKISLSNASASNFFGLSKKARLTFAEMSEVLGKINIKESDWYNSKGIKMDAFVKLPIYDTIAVDDKNLFIHKDKVYLILKYNTIPFSWSEMQQKQNMPYYAIKICTK
jgi:antimicrobial peptide system SdpA family protein